LSPGRARRAATGFGKLTVLIPARDEARFVGDVVRRVQKQLRGLPHEIIVVDDGSRDGTAAAARRAGAVVLRQNPGQGKGGAIQTGLRHATGEWILIQDADLEYDPEDVPGLLAPIRAGRAEVVYGSRILGAAAGKKTGISNRRFYWGGRFLSWLTTLLYGARITDVSTGYKIFRARLLRDIAPAGPGFEFCAEVTAKLLRRRIRIVEIPISYSPRSFAEGKKIRWSDGLRAIWTLLKHRWDEPPLPQASPERKRS
jgi:glycosyltransferase involved in cell wall biosynthesis